MRPNSFCCMWLSSFSGTISWKDCLGTLENQLTIYTRVYFWDPFSVPLASMSIFYASTTTVFDYYGFVVCSETKKCETSSFVLLLYDCFLAIWDPLKLHMNLRVGFPYQKRKNKLKLKLQYFGHLMRRTNLEKTLMLGKIEGTRKGWQRMRWLYGITDSMDMNLSNLQELVIDRETWHATVQGFAKSRTWLSD